jgi:hypothetical protein
MVIGWTGGGVTPLLERCWPAVERVAAELLVTGQVGHCDACPRQPHPHFLAPASNIEK